MKDDVAIRVSGLSKKYEIGKQKDGSLRGSLASIFRSSAKAKDEFWALKDVNFEVKKGEVIGIIGKNGAGKSTLLKVLSQITKPSSGKIEINGRVASLLEVGTGFHPELTGRENVYLNGTILGMTRKEVASKFDEIVAFSGVEKFIDTPVKHYSSGMYVRLAFAVAAHLEPEILIIDEVLAVGDAEFQKKCLGKMKDVAGEGRTVIFVSHNMAAVRNLCDKGILIEKGEVKFEGKIDDVVSEYSNRFTHGSSYINRNLNDQFKVYIQSLRIKDKSGSELGMFTVEDKIYLHLKISFKIVSDQYRIMLTIKNSVGNPVFSIDEIVDEPSFIIELESNFLSRGDYVVDAFLHIPKVEKFHEIKGACGFSVKDFTSTFSIYREGLKLGDVFPRYKIKK